MKAKLNKIDHQFFLYDNYECYCVVHCRYNEVINLNQNKDESRTNTRDNYIFKRSYH